MHKSLARVRTLKTELAAAEKARREGLYDVDDEKSPEAVRILSVLFMLSVLVGLRYTLRFFFFHSVIGHQERVRQVQGAVAAAERDVQDVFLSVLRYFVDALTAHLASLPPATDAAHDTDAARGLWYYRTSGHLREFLRRYYLSLKVCRCARVYG